MNFQLAINTSQNKAQLLLLTDKNIIASRFWEKSNSHSEMITQEFGILLESNKLRVEHLDKIFCVVGPGSFTGVRVGVSFAKSLAFASRCKIVPINTLDLFASQWTGSQNHIVSMIDAQKNSVFLSIYSFVKSEIKKQKENLVVPIDKLKKWIPEGSAVCGDAHLKFQEIQTWQSELNLRFNDHWTSTDLENYLKRNLFDTSALDWQMLQPLYIKSSAPEEKLNPTDVD